MFDPLRIALVAEGPTDRVVVEAAVNAMLPDRPFVLTQVQPEGSLVFGELGGGWVGVYRWCKQASARGGGRLSDDALLYQNYDALILHVYSRRLGIHRSGSSQNFTRGRVVSTQHTAVHAEASNLCNSFGVFLTFASIDAAVAGYDYAEGSIEPDPGDAQLPCERPCPPAHDTTNALRSVVLSWCGEQAVPKRTVFCLPSKSTEAWVVAALFPDDKSMEGHIECWPRPESRLGQQPKKLRIRKSQRDYKDRVSDIEEAWSRLTEPGAIGKALRFQNELLAELTTL
ncbi:MAG: hypothetical protein GW911_09770 [Armatimonadetes bacterium]|nr:hypothetical protein [Armatimonadota bacterium]NDK12325.1 hypothetical protein [Armatimonadota bacterium]